MTQLELREAVRCLDEARNYQDVFGLMTTETNIEASIKRTFRNLARVLHPDRYQDAARKQLAASAFTKLGQFRQQAEAAAKRGRYDDRSVSVVATKRGRHTITDRAVEGDVCTTFYGVSTINFKDIASFVKIAKNSRDADLLQREAMVLKTLHGTDAETKWQHMVPTLLDSFVYSDPSKQRRQANVLERLQGFYTLEQVRQAFPDGVRPHHMVWMFRRLLMALGFAHDNQVIHGAVLPRHIMILPEHHGLVLVDWCYASQATDDQTQPVVPAIVDSYRQWYPKEVCTKHSPSPATDIVMAARCMIYLLRGDPLTGVLPACVPLQLRAFLRGCLQVEQSMRPQNAWLLLQEFDELLESMGAPYFPRRFRPFVMPTGTA